MNSAKYNLIIGQIELNIIFETWKNKDFVPRRKCNVCNCVKALAGRIFGSLLLCRLPNRRPSKCRILCYYVDFQITDHQNVEFFVIMSTSKSPTIKMSKKTDIDDFI
jgi:hypothetical protein